MVVPQLVGDGLWTVHDIAELSLRQAVTPDQMRGRVNIATVTASLAGNVLGSRLAGAIVGPFGLRSTLAVGASLTVLAGLSLFFSPVRRTRDFPSRSS